MLLQIALPWCIDSLTRCNAFTSTTFSFTFNAKASTLFLSFVQHTSRRNPLMLKRGTLNSSELKNYNFYSKVLGRQKSNRSNAVLVTAELHPVLSVQLLQALLPVRVLWGEHSRRRMHYMVGRAGSLGRIIAHGWKSGYGVRFVGDVLKEECIKRGYYTRVKNTLWRALELRCW